MRIFMCTRDTIEFDLLVNGVEEDLIREVEGTIIDEINSEPSVEIDGNYIVGGTSAAYISEKYNINFVSKVIA